MTWLDKHERIFELIETRYELHPPKACDMVAVVRCRDCAYFDDEGEFGQWCTQLDFGKKEIADGFCAWGVRRDE